MGKSVVREPIKTPKRATRRTPRLVDVTIEKRGKRFTITARLVTSPFNIITWVMDGRDDHFVLRTGNRIDLEVEPNMLAWLEQEMPMESVYGQRSIFRRDIATKTFSGYAHEMPNSVRLWFERSTRDLLKEMIDEGSIA